MKLSDINTYRLLPNFCKNNDYIISLCGTLDYIIQSISDRMDALPLNAGGSDALYMCRDDELAELASECINAPYYPDTDIDERVEMMLAQEWWTWQTGTIETYDYALDLALNTGGTGIEELTGKLKHHYDITLQNIHVTKLLFKRMFNVTRENCHVTATLDNVRISYITQTNQKIGVAADIRLIMEASDNV